VATRKRHIDEQARSAEEDGQPRELAGSQVGMQAQAHGSSPQFPTEGAHGIIAVSLHTVFLHVIMWHSFVADHHDHHVSSVPSAITVGLNEDDVIK